MWVCVFAAELRNYTAGQSCSSAVLAVCFCSDYERFAPLKFSSLAVFLHRLGV